MRSLFILSLIIILGYTAYADCNLPAPGGLKATNILSCQLNVNWNTVPGASGYSIKYKLTSSSEWLKINTSLHSFTLTGLNSNSAYQVKISAVCSNGMSGKFSAPIAVNTTSCSVPINISVSNITANSAAISWSVSCGASKFKLKYRIKNTTPWIVINNITAASYSITNLIANQVYEVKVQSICEGNSHSDFTKSVEFTTTGGFSSKNVLLVIIDDARFDTYLANNGPAFFVDTNISRIAFEGANFKLSFAAQSQCAPSRATITTGTYPHINGILNNPPTLASHDTILIPTLPEILHNHGYYTGLIGKYHISGFPQPGYDYWLENHDNDYTNSHFNYNGIDKIIPQHQTDVVTDSAINFLKHAPANQPFFLWLGYRAPHKPYTPRAEEEGIFDNDTMPFPDNYDAYTENYPGFLYDCHNAHKEDKLIEDYRSYFESLQGVEVCIGKVWNQLEEMGIMDSTLIIFMSDNGYLMGEHHYEEKQLVYEESMKIPVFMRYPKLITAGTLYNSGIAMNIDIAPTILDFAGIPQTYGMQGRSLFKMLGGQTKRKEMLYEWHHQECVPDFRAIRSLSGKYVQYNCSDSTEEFFDLVLDNKENTNQIFNPVYADSIQLYEDKLDFWRNFYQDYTWDSLYTCSLSNIQQRGISAQNDVVTLMNVFPNPSSTHLTVHFMSSESAASSLRIVNVLGNILYEETMNDPTTEFSRVVSTEKFPAGNYFAVVTHSEHSYKKTFSVQ